MGGRLATAFLRPALVDAVLVLLLLEAAWLGWRGRRSGEAGAGFALSFTAAGAGLLIALRAVLAGWPAWVTLSALAVAGAANAWHVAWYLAGGRGPRNPPVSRGD